MFALLNANLLAQVWEPVGNPAGISAGGAGRLSLKVDVQDNVVVGYYDVSVAKGSVQKFEANNWTYLGGGPGMTSGYATYNSLSLDNQGVVYFTNQASGPTTGLNVHKFVNNAWESLPDATTATINFQASAVSANGTLFVATGEGSGSVKRFVNGVWEQVGNTGFFGGLPYYLTLTISNDDRIYASWNNNGFVHVYTNTVNASTTDLWEPVGNVANIAPATTSENYNSAIAVDNANHLFLAYVSNSAGGRKLNVKKYDGVTWSQLGPENFTEHRVQHISIAIGDDDIIYVAASNWEDQDLLRNYVMAYDEAANVWYQAGTGWASEGQATNNSLAVDSYGNLYLGFVDSGLGKLSVKKLNLNIVAADSLEITAQGGGTPEITTDGGSLQLLATVFPSQASQQVVWSVISGQNFATIDQNGVLTAIASNAVVTVKAQTAENSSIFNTIDVNIINQVSPVQPEETTVTVENNANADILSLSSVLQLVAVTTPPEADQYVTWTVQEGTGVLTVDANGLVQPLAEGYAIVRATNNANPALFDEIRVNVWENGCTQYNESMMAGMGYGINNGYSSADDFVVNSEMRFKVGTVRLRLITESLTEFTSFSLNFLANDIDRPGEQIFTTTVSPTTQTLFSELGSFYVYDVQLDLTNQITLDQGRYWLNPVANTLNGNLVYWDVTNITGGIEGFGLYVDYSDGHGWRGTGELNAVFEITGSCTQMPLVVSTLNGGEASVFVGETLQLQAVVNFPGLSQSVIWSVDSGSEYASVNQDGLVTGIGAGIATIKAVSSDNSSVFGVLDVTVHDPNECFQQVPSNNMENGYTFGGVQLAIDIDVPSGQTFTISSIDINTGGMATTFSFEFLKDVDGLPGDEVIASATGNIVHNKVIGYHDVYLMYFHQYTIELNTPVVLNPGKYWMKCTSDATAWESTSSNIIGHPGAFKSQASGDEWMYSSTNSEYVYIIGGLCNTLEGPAIATDPESFTVTFDEPNGQTTEILSISNEGNTTLNWSAGIEYLIGTGNWLSVTPNSGSVEPGQSMDVDVSFNAQGIQGENLLTANIILSSNDPSTPEKTVPCMMTLTVGIENQALSNLKVYPNPAFNEINFELTENIISVGLIDALGQMTKEETVNGKSSLKWDTSNLPGGIYYLVFKDKSGNNLYKKIIVM